MKLKLGSSIEDEGCAIALPRAAIASGTILRPTFASRVHYGVPKARGHRQFIESRKQEWR